MEKPNSTPQDWSHLGGPSPYPRVTPTVKKTSSSSLLALGIVALIPYTAWMVGLVAMFVGIRHCRAAQRRGEIEVAASGFLCAIFGFFGILLTLLLGIRP